ncbi:MAG: DUF4129 domain-containing protein [Acidobacteriota bacterium]
MKLSHDSEGKKALDLVEEAVLLLRRLPLAGWAALYLGALPYILVFLFYLMSLVHNPAASQQLVGYSALLAALYAWLKFWQSVFAAEIWRLRSGTSAVSWRLRTVLRVVRDHLRYSAVSLAALLVSSILVFPLAWSYAVHQNLVLTVLPGFDARRPRPGALKPSWEQALLWPGQNHLIMLLLGLISLFAFANFAACLVFFPYLVKALTGWESAFTRLGARLFDFKMFVAALVLTYLAVLPLARVIYVLRCFYGSSLRTGADLLSDLRSRRVAALILLLFCLAGSGQALALGAGDDSRSTFAMAPASAASVSPSRLDESISTVLRSRKHLWQAPSHARKIQEPSIWRDVVQAVQRALEKLADWLGRALRWLKPADSPTRRTSGGRSVNVRDVAVALLVVCSLGLAALVIRALLELRSRPSRPGLTQSGGPVDLRRAELSPDELPEEKWLDLAVEMMENGQARLAVRAIYLAAIVVLGKRDLVTPTRFKSNRDYLIELRQRHRGNEAPITSFQSMIGMFEKVWYGRHEPARHDFDEMQRLLALLKA